MAADDRAHMLEAIRLASSEHPHPNPRVGAVVLAASGRVLASAAHMRRGEPHAEALALSRAGRSAVGGTLVVTLEPCVHTGATPPCVEAIAAAGIQRVVVAVEDPDPKVSGRGIAALRAAGVEVTVGVAGDEAEALDAGYFHHRRTGRPRVTLKMAATLDGQAGAADGTSQWITSETARADVHVLRSRSDAVMVGAGTVLADDPRLTVRIQGASSAVPRPVVVAGSRPIPRTAAVVRDGCVVYAPAPADLAPAETVVVVSGPGGVDLEAVVDDLGRREVIDLLVEGGPRLAGNLLRSGLVDRVLWYLGGGLAGGTGLPVLEGSFDSLERMVPVEVIAVDRLGPDIRVEAKVRAA